MMQKVNFVTFGGRQKIINLFYEWLETNNIRDESYGRKKFLSIFVAWLYGHEYEVNECKDRQRLWDEIAEDWNREKKFREIQMEKYTDKYADKLC